MRVTKESSDAEALDGEGNCKDIKTVKAKDKITISRFLDYSRFSSKSKKIEKEFIKTHHSYLTFVYSARIEWGFLKMSNSFFVKHSHASRWNCC